MHALCMKHACLDACFMHSACMTHDGHDEEIEILHCIGRLGLGKSWTGPTEPRFALTRSCSQMPTFHVDIIISGCVSEPMSILCTPNPTIVYNALKRIQCS